MSRPSVLRTLASSASSSSVVYRRGYASIPGGVSSEGSSYSRTVIPVRSYAASSSQPYPFSTSAKPALPSSTPSTPLAPQLIRPKNGWHLITHLRTSYRSQLDPKSLVTTWFSRRHPDRLRPGSVLSVSSWSTPSKTGSTSFAGVLMAIRRSGPDTSFRLRNIVSRVGVEMSYKVCSPMIKEIKVIKKVERGGTLVKLASGKLGRVGKPLRRAKANFLRDKPDLLASIAGGVKEK